MADLTYACEWIPNNYVSRVQRSAVLYPIAGRCASPRAIAETTFKLVGWWRARLTVLAAAGFDVRGDGYGFARNCLPAFAYCRPASRPCGNRSLCPFCYARWAGKLWETVDAGFPGERGDQRVAPLPPDYDNPIDDGYDDGLIHTGGGVRLRRALIVDDVVAEPEARYDLLTYFRSFAFPLGDPARPDVAIGTRVRSLMEQAIDARYRRIRNLSPRGAVSHLTVEPVKRGWLFRLRELFMLDRGAKTPDWRDQVQRTESPTRRQIMNAVIQVCRYPTRLLTGDPEVVAELLNARHGRATRGMRLTASYGVFRKGSRGD